MPDDAEAVHDADARAADAHEADADGKPDIEDLLGPFEVIRRVLEARRAADRAQEEAAALTPPARPPVPAPGSGSAAPALPSRAPGANLSAFAAGPAGGGRIRTAPDAEPSNGADADAPSPLVTRRPIADGPPVDGTPASRPPGITDAAIDRPAAGPAARLPETGPARPRSFGRRGVLAAVAAVCVLGAAVVGITTLSGSRGRAATAETAAAAVQQPSADPTPQTVRAVAWLVGAVAPTNVVACDMSACALLRELGFPAASLITVQSGADDVEQADVVVLSPLLRARLGSRAAALAAAEPLAAFGSGSAEVEVAAVALDGPAAYARALAADRQGRELAGKALAANPRLALAPRAEAQLAAGLVDTRVCTLLAVLLGTHHLVVTGFGPAAPGAGPDQPLAVVVVGSLDGRPTTGGSPAATLLTAAVHAQRAPYLALSAGPAPPGGPTGEQIAFSVPEPSGLLPGAGS